ncbi:MAG: ATP-binding cassette domain-containing protein [Actinobacteria bacterium]|nr:ATP-binding cassette domain-containing protein [Actinomycetota bacterium]
MSVLAFEISTPVVVLGALTGILYGLLAVGLVLVYRTNRVINFAHGEIGAFGAALFSIFVVRWGLPYWLMLPVAMAVAGAVGGTAEVVAIRRLRSAPSLMSVVATLGIGQLLLSFSAAINPSALAGLSYPSPPWMPTFDVGALRVTPAYSAMLILGPAVVLSLGWFLRSSRWGRALRAAAANPEAARLNGIPAARMSTLAWGLAAALSALTAILVSPTRGFAAASAFGPSLLLRALAAAVLARMDRLVVAFVGGIGIGVLEQVVLANAEGQGSVELALFAVVVVGLVVQRPIGGRLAERTAWTNVQPWRPLPAELRAITAVRCLGPIVGIVAAAATAIVIGVVTNATAYTFVAIMALAIVGLGATVVSGMLGELSLGLVAFGALGSVASIEIATRTGNFALAFAASMVVAGGLSVVTGLPSLRAKGLLITVTTLAFAVVTSVWALGQDWALALGERPGRPVVGSFAFESGRSYAWLTLGLLVVAFVAARNIAGGALGRRFVAVRDNASGAQAFGVSAARTKLLGLFVGGAFAGLGGALFTHSLPVATPQSFPISDNIEVVAMVAIGGIGVVMGPLLGALYIVGLPRLVPLDSAALAATAAGWLLLVMYVPGGLAKLIAPLRERVLARLAVRHGVDPLVLRAGAPDRAASVGGFVAPQRPASPPGPLLVGTGLAKRFGGLQAVDGVDLVVEANTIVGLIGPNGAGKTTLFELLAGFTSPDAGTVRFDGRDVTRRSAAARSRAGLVRGFQDAALFPSLTVSETVELALEGRDRARVLGSVVGIDRGRSRRRAAADELVSSLGLSAWRDTPVGELSTGTRRITELACLVALEPKVVLLDEPSSGLAQREVEALAQVLRDLRDVSGMTVVLIEHDIPLVMGVADRVVAMAAGTVMKAGTPVEVRDDPEVIRVYLGDDTVAVARSDTST